MVKLKKKRRDWRLDLNLEIFPRAKFEPRDGDWFALKLKGRGYLFGRVIRARVHVGSMEGVLVYVYNKEMDSIETIPKVLLKDLLVPPLIIEELSWTAGLLKVLERRPLLPREVLKQHCFRRVNFDGYVDEKGKRLTKRSKPCGHFGITTPYGLASDVSEAAGFPPDED